MRRLSSLILLLVLSASLSAQKSPHGDSFRANCDDCHKTDGWKVDLKAITFDHSGTNFPLVGQHQTVSCRDCHISLEFAKAQTQCNACHKDIHEQTVGNECKRCHTPNSWMVTGITQLHQQSRFPLVGAHATADCKACHTNLAPSASKSPTASLLRFDPLGIECYDCHKKNYSNAIKPNHVLSNYSKNCTDCHNINSFEWKGVGINHNFFPLEGGHALNNCSTCHTSGSYSKIPSECVSCHQPEFTTAKNPNHKSLNFSTNCKDCHSLSPGWKPAEYRDHDAKSFPIYSGKHKGEWDDCSDCHTNAGNYSQFSCVDCHEHSKNKMDNEHEGVSGYKYNSIACFSCHPKGSGEGSFDHSKSNFPLTGAHITTACLDCHTNGFAGTSNACSNCHTNKYNQTTNPNHLLAGISNDCAKCHTTQPTWKPATYPAHSKLIGAHLPIANNCADCHKGNYTNLPKTCFACHTNDYDQTKNPNHVTSQFSIKCESCHSQNTWSPSTFNHNITYPLTGAHATIAGNCTQCHTNGYSNTPNTCVGCHQPNYTQSANPSHSKLAISSDCASCHTTNPGWEPAKFPTHNNYYKLEGAHIPIANDCATCHKGNYANSNKTCYTCHTQNYTQTNNPSHSAAQFPTTCADCHTQSAWTPATFNHDAKYFPIYSGKHKGEWANCVECHTTANNYALFSCINCHEHNQTDMNSKHKGIGGYQYNSIACYKCHPKGSGDKVMDNSIFRSN